MRTVTEILSPLKNLREEISKKVLNVLKELMKETGTPVLLFRGYTSEYNDGDGPIHITVYFGPPGKVDSEDRLAVFEDGKVKFKERYKQEEIVKSSTWPEEANGIVEIIEQYVIHSDTMGYFLLDENGELEFSEKGCYEED